MSENVKEHIKLYYKIGAALLVLTIVTVGVSYIDFAVPLTIFLALVIAATKGSLVASYFMHLIDERKSIYAALLLTAFFFLVLIFIPILGHTNTFGEYKTLPNANAPVAERTLYLQSHRGNEPQRYRNFAAVTQHYKLVQPRSFGQPMPAKPVFELYDLEADVGEQNNLAEQEPDIVARLKAGYEAWFDDVSSTRGYDPPKIPLGTEHENPVILTRQDWRIVGPDGYGDQNLGYWEIEVASPGEYEIRFRFPQQETAGRAEFKLGDAKQSKSFTRGGEAVTFANVTLRPGPGLLEARLVRGGKTVGVKYVDVKKL